MLLDVDAYGGRFSRSKSQAREKTTRSYLPIPGVFSCGLFFPFYEAKQSPLIQTCTSISKKFKQCRYLLYEMFFLCYRLIEDVFLYQMTQISRREFFRSSSHRNVFVDVRLTGNQKIFIRTFRVNISDSRVEKFHYNFEQLIISRVRMPA